MSHQQPHQQLLAPPATPHKTKATPRTPIVTGCIGNYFTPLNLEFKLDKDENFVHYCTPRCDISEDDNGFMLQIHLEGYEENQIHVVYNKSSRVLTMKGERPLQQGEEHLVEYSKRNGPTPKTPSSIVQCHKFERTFLVPLNANPDDIEFAFDNGLLVVQIPKNGGAKSH